MPYTPERPHLENKFLHKMTVAYLTQHVCNLELNYTLNYHTLTRPQHGKGEATQALSSKDKA